MKEYYGSMIRVTTVSPMVTPGDIKGNTDRILREINDHHGKTDILVFPELSITGYTCGDMFLNPDFIRGARKAIERIQKQLNRESPVTIVGCPIEDSGKLYNSAVVIGSSAENPLVIPKRNLPNYSEFYERRWFDVPEPGPSRELGDSMTLLTSGVFEVSMRDKSVRIGVEVCEDLWAVNPPSVDQVLNYGAEIIINLSASPRLVGKEAYLKDLIRMTSARLACGYVYVSAGPSESSTDLVFSGFGMVSENGVRVDTGREFPLAYIDEIHRTTVDLDLDTIRGWRRKNKTITNEIRPGRPEVTWNRSCGYTGKPMRTYNPHPFLPGSKDELPEILRTMSLGLQKRLDSTGSRSAVIGVSGGSDSTLALLVLCSAFDALDLDRAGILAVSMPCFGTTDRTKNNAKTLAESLGVTFKEIPIRETVKSHLGDLGHPLEVTDVAYENAQARTRTMTLFDLSNMTGGLVIGTGDLSELALGWCTYGADHLSSYNPNVSIPKTLVPALIRVYLEGSDDRALRDTLSDIIDTPISPELLPGTQLSEDTVGPYDLMDYFLWHILRAEWDIRKILWTACRAFEGTYSEDFVRERLIVFLKRFQTQQFKRSCLPDGPKVGSASLSPRGDWRMPSDLDLSVMIKKIEQP